MADKCIIVGVTGGIAAYKVPDLVSRLVKAGADVHVIMTKAAAEFITPLTMQTISRNPVTTGMFELPKEWRVQHISLADRADLLVVVPATANIIGKVCAGIADDILSTTIMATRAPVLFAPAMNVHMYENPIVQNNMARLKSMGYHFLEPDTGFLACGYEGRGRLPDIDVIFDTVCQLAAGGRNPVKGFGQDSYDNSTVRPRDLTGETILVTAGPTREHIDPVRFLSNGSSGKMGYSLAEAARMRGARVILISGPVSIPVPAGVMHIPVVSARDMFEAVKKHYPEADVIIKTAAVADYHPKFQHKTKMKKGEGDLVLELARNPDILKYLGENKGGRIIVGFAAETDNLIQNAVNKITAKNLDFIVANDITMPDAGFGTDTNIVKVIYRDGRIEQLDKMDKKEVAHQILDRVKQLLDRR